jgi:hypothetical protein
MTEDACRLDKRQRKLVESTIADHCRIRGWTLYAVNCRTCHVHVVVAAEVAPDQVRRQLKAWCARRLKELERRLGSASHEAAPRRRQWWSERGSRRFINDESSLEAAIRYVIEAHDKPREG